MVPFRPLELKNNLETEEDKEKRFSEWVNSIFNHINQEVQSEKVEGKNLKRMHWPLQPFF